MQSESGSRIIFSAITIIVFVSTAAASVQALPGCGLFV